jgi:zeaxanthin epoxidase
VDGHVVLLGDSAHAMQPNLGQGGGMAIEDAFQLATDLGDEVEAAGARGREPSVDGVLNEYFRKRLVRASAIHGMAGMAAFMASTYKAYLGEGLGPLSWITRFKIPHPGRVAGYVAMKLTMPSVLEWVLGGYKGALDASGARATACRLGDQPQGFDEADFPLFMRDDDALLRAAHAQWMLQPMSAAAAAAAGGAHIHAGAVPIGGGGLTVGRDPGCTYVLDAPGVAPAHARLERVGQDYFVTDLGSQAGTYRDGRRLPAGQRVRVLPGDILGFGAAVEEGEAALKVKLRHVSLADGEAGRGYDRVRRIGGPPRTADREMALSS